MLNLQWFNTQKKSKIKAAQDIFAVEVKVNEKNTQINKDEVKLFLHDDSLIKVIKNNYRFFFNSYSIQHSL